MAMGLTPGIGDAMPPANLGAETVATNGQGTSTVLARSPLSDLGFGPAGPSQILQPGHGLALGGVGLSSPAEAISGPVQALTAPTGLPGRVAGVSDLPSPQMSGPSQAMTNGVSMDNKNGLTHSLTASPSVAEPQVAGAAVSPALAAPAANGPMGSLGNFASSVGNWIKANPMTSIAMAASAYMLINPPSLLQGSNFLSGGMAKLPMVGMLAYGGYQMFKNLTNNSAPGSGPAPTGKSGGAAA